MPFTWLILFSETRMEEESKGEPSKVESVNLDQNQSPKKVAWERLVSHFFGLILQSMLQGPTLSTSTSSFEALDPHDPQAHFCQCKTFSWKIFFFQLNLLASTMFSKTADWIGEKDLVPSPKKRKYKFVQIWLGRMNFLMLSIFQLVNWKVQVQSISCWNKWTGENWVILQTQNWNMKYLKTIF